MLPALLVLILAGGPPALIDITDLFGARADGARSTFLTACRCKPAQPCPTLLVEDLAIPPERTAVPCWEGLEDRHGGKTLLSREADAAARKLREEGGQAARAVKVAFVNERYVSVYLAQSHFTPGAAHAQNSLTCKTFDRKTGKAVTLAELIEPGPAKRVLARLQQALADHEFSLAKLGEDLAFDGEGYTVSGESLLLQPSQPPAEFPALVLCATAPHNLAGTIKEVRLDDLPLLLLF